MKPPGVEPIAPRTVAVLLEVVAADEAGEPQDITTVARRVGLSRTCAYERLDALRSADLVDFGEGRRGGLVPRVQRVPLT